MEWILLIAQATDPISGGAGWVGAGLLGLVLSWFLFIRLPVQDKLLKDYIAVKDEQLANLVASKDEQLRIKDEQVSDMLQKKWDVLQKMSTDYRESVKLVTEHCTQEMQAMTAAWQNGIDKLIKMKLTHFRHPNEPTHE